MVNHLLGLENCGAVKAAPLPQRRDRLALQHLRDPTPRGFRRIKRQGIEREEAGFDDFMVRDMRRGLLELPDQEDRDVIAPCPLRIEIDTDQPCFAREAQIAFLPQFLGQGVGQCFARLDATARHVPALYIGMTDKKNAVLIIDHHATHAQRHAPRKARPQQEQPLDQAKGRARSRIEGRVRIHPARIASKLPGRQKPFPLRPKTAIA